MSRSKLLKIIIYILIILLVLFFAKQVHSIFARAEIITNAPTQRESFRYGYLYPKPILKTPDSRVSTQASTTRVTAPRVGVERVKDLIKKYFPNNYQEALSVAICESGLDNTAQNDYSSAAGVFQILDRTWGSNAPDIPRSEKYDAESNIMIASRIFARRKWQPWEKCQP